MTDQDKILHSLSVMEIMAENLLKEAAMLRRKVLADGRPAPSRKGIDPAIVAKVHADHAKRMARRKTQPSPFVNIKNHLK